MLRTHTCGELCADNNGQEVTLCGWVDSTRDHGGAVFLDLRDRYGKTQIVFGPDSGEQNIAEAGELRSEDVIRVTGSVAPRPEGTVNNKLPTGEIEIRGASLETARASRTSLGKVPARRAKPKIPPGISAQLKKTHRGMGMPSGPKVS